MRVAKKPILLCCILFISRTSFGESKYQYDLKTDAVLGVLSLGVAIPPFFFSGSPGKDRAFEKKEINPFDRPAVFPYHKGLDVTGDIGMYGLAVLPVLSLMGNITDLNALATYGIMYAESFLLTLGILEILKISITRYRPYMYFDGRPSDKDDYFKSFASRHTAIAFMSAGFLSSTFCTEYPDSPWKIPITAISYALAAGVGVSRVVSGNHFMTDVIAGGAVGSLFGYLIPWLHLPKPSRSGVAFAPVLGGFTVSWKL
jgi:undecaprenyl-diphosphatase